MDALKNFKRVVEKFSSDVNFLLVYVKEAHPKELEEIWHNIEVSQHHNLEDRLEAAKILADVAPFVEDVAVDVMSDEAERLFGAWPERFFIIRASDGFVVHESAVGPFDAEKEFEKAENVLEKMT